MSGSPPALLIAGQSARFVLRERTVALLAAMFVILVMLSAWMGWSATTTVNRIYTDAAAFLTATGKPVPTNPVLDISPLSLMRNMSVYVALIGALAAIVIGNRLVAVDRKAGVLPLIGVRPMTSGSYALAKIVALVLLVGLLTAVSAAVSVVTFMVLPTISISSAQWLQLAGFLTVSAIYMLLFGLIGLAAAASCRSETVGLLIPVTVWLTLTFIFPQIISNLHPTAAINPVSALAARPDAAFFWWTGQILGPFSLADSFKYASAGLLDYLPEGIASQAVIPPVADLMLAAVVLTAVSWRTLTRMPMAQGDYDV